MAKTIAAIELWNVAAHSAYCAMFHAAQAFIFARTGKVTKTHSGLRSEFSCLAKDTVGFDMKLTGYLAKAYGYTETGDCGIGAHSQVPMNEARNCITHAAHFLDSITAILTVSPAAPPSSPL